MRYNKAFEAFQPEKVETPVTKSSSSQQESKVVDKRSPTKNGDARPSSQANPVL